MRIDRLDLIAYGPFTNKSLNFCHEEYGLHLIYGDNEAGKSSALRALIAWLFGIPARTNDNFLHPNPQLRIGGKLRLSDGRELEFLRRKGTKGTLLGYGTDEPLDEGILAQFLHGGIDENIFVKLFGIDHPRLVAGGQELLNQSGDLGQALFSAAVGTASLREILVELQSDAEEIYKPRASTKTLNEAISKYKDAQKRIKDNSLPTAQWQELHRDLSGILSEIVQVEKDIESRNKAKSRLNRLDRVKGALAERRDVINRINDLGEVLLLPEDFEEQRKAASEKLQAASESKKKAEAKLRSLEEESGKLNIHNELMEYEPDILSLFKDLGAVEKTIRDRPQQDGKRRQLRNEAEALLKGVRPDIKLDNADDLRRLLNNKKWISSLVQKHGRLIQKKETAESDLRDIGDEEQSLRKQLAELPQTDLDLSELKAAISSARKAGDVEQRLADKKKRAYSEKSACEEEFRKLGRFSGSVESLLKVAMPVSETLDIFEKESEDLLDKRKDCERRERQIGKEEREADKQLKELLLTSDVPTISELEGARNARDRGWRLIKKKYIEKADVEKDILEFARESDLPTIYEQKVDNADHVSDRLRLATDLVVKRAGLEAKREDLKSALDDVAAEIKKTIEIQEAHRDRWDAIWKPLGIAQGTPREMKQWLLRVERLTGRVHSANELAAEEKELAEQLRGLKENVSIQLRTFEDSIRHQEMSLEEMICLCEGRVEKEEGIREKRRALEKSLSDAGINLKRKIGELKAIELEESNWLQEWGQAIKGLGLEPDAHPEHATETFDRLVAFFDKLDNSEDLRKRIYGMDQVEEKFNKKVFEFVDLIGFKRDDREAATIATQLHRELNDAREARAKLREIEIQIKEKKGEIQEIDITIRAAKEQLVSLRDQAGVETDDDLIAAAEQSREKRKLQLSLERIEQELNRNGDGLGIEELEKEADESDTDAIEGELERVSSELRELQEKRDDLRDRRQTLQGEIKARDGSAAAANASQEAEEYLSTMVSSAEQYLRLRIAALILERRIEDYRRKNQAPVLARAGKLFSRLTLGSYTNLRDELDASGKPILLGVRPNDEEVPVDGMSDGARDQLYLALRLATLEQHLSKGEPMPFVVDDILIGFDDKRTRVCLEVLAQLAAQTQVLLFTHHRRVLELANAIDSKAVIFTYEL